MKAPVRMVGIALLLFTGCRKENQVEPACGGSCTVIKGRFVTDNGAQPISKLPVEIKWIKSTGIIGGTIRRKAATKTDASGYYELRFYVKDDELTDGHFAVQYAGNSADYVLDRENKGASFLDLTRDTVITSDWLLPRKAYIDFELTNPTSTPSPYYGYTTFSFANGSFPRQGRFGYGVVVTWHDPGTTRVEVAANQLIDIETLTTKNGVRVVTHDTIRLRPGSHYTHRDHY
ncbi:hypothetical protein F0P96_07705 [Hymenobacter busanensis]|uniref:Uncharacterized protein n=1 Tax=Hymenobacter busanensis TaxID=2607656 RepID=A0A7L5A330_9BACT|nr:hypothetical protein [Hymenobacter busanensis]KAA9338697.1 hypothetical protein F0P96_07705 [Hymenobacter busanensis]QHJ08872.1 hypothetical protein GUY19_16895 [Hymenobacter busanensis]